MSKMKFNEVELELDLMDADIMEKYEYEIQKVVSDIQEPNQYKGKTTAQGMRLQCRYQYAGDSGYNPGSQMVQIVGISLLDPVDHYVKEKLHVKRYIRYWDF